jgi:competence ComEA-like helix-hairpin-helix protein
MKAMRWIGVLGLVAWCVGAGVAAGSEDKTAKAEAVDGKGHGRADVHKVNINGASKADLMKLDGVTAGVAQKIIAYRDAHGPFKRAHDLVKVDGVGKEVLEKNAGRIAVK